MSEKRKKRKERKKNTKEMPGQETPEERKATEGMEGRWDLKDYAEALEWIDHKTKEYGGKNKFLSSEEYRARECEIRQLYNLTLAEHTNKALQNAKMALCEMGAKSGQKVEYSVASPFGTIGEQIGTIYIDKKGLPRVKLISGKSVRWHKGFWPMK